MRPARRAAWRLGWIVVAAACAVDDKRAAPADGGEPRAPDAPDAPDGPVDADAPDTVIDAAPAPLTNERQATFRFSSSDPRATFTCQLDAHAAQPCASPFVRTLADGPHRFSVQAADAAGHVDETPAAWAWTIDSVAPDTMLTARPPRADNSTTATFGFRASEPDASFECALDGAAFVACSPPWSYDGLAEGAHGFAVRARDAAGNTDPSPAPHDWVVDLTPPETWIVDGPRGEVQGDTASFAFTASEPNVTFACSLDGAALAPCSSPVSYTALDRGEHAFAVRATDAAGQIDPTPATQTWKIDRKKPRPPRPRRAKCAVRGRRRPARARRRL